jgi:hypothetical protein
MEVSDLLHGLAALPPVKTPRTFSRGVFVGIDVAGKEVWQFEASTVVIRGTVRRRVLSGGGYQIHTNTT